MRRSDPVPSMQCLSSQCYPSVRQSMRVLKRSILRKEVMTIHRHSIRQTASLDSVRCAGVHMTPIATRHLDQDWPDWHTVQRLGTQIDRESARCVRASQPFNTLQEVLDFKRSSDVVY